MSNALVTLNQGQWTPDQMKLITDVVARGATKDELNLFLYRCQNMGLDPLKPGQVHFIKYGNSPGTIVVGIEGFRLIAERTGKKSGVKRGVLKEDGKLVGAWCEVYRSDWKEPAREEVPLDEYNTGKGPWAKMPETMIKKVAEAAALRMAFPDALGGVYIREEMDQADAGLPRVKPEQPGANDGAKLPGPAPFRFVGGQYNKRAPHELNEEELRGLIERIEAQATHTKDDLRNLEKAHDMLATYQNMEPIETSAGPGPQSDEVPPCPHCQEPMGVSQFKDKRGINNWYCRPCKATKLRDL